MRFLILLFLVGCSGDPWTRADTNRQLVVTGLVAIDAYQTMKIQYDPQLIEGSPLPQAILGKNPSTAATYQYFMTLMLSQCLITRLLPKRLRPYYQGVTALDHLYGIRKNIRAGL